jgi:hypothetical protein
MKKILVALLAAAGAAFLFVAVVGGASQSVAARAPQTVALASPNGVSWGPPIID